MYLRIFTATDFVGHETITSSLGVTIDMSPPATPGTISTGGSVHNHIEQVKISWFGAFTDQESGVLLLYTVISLFIISSNVSVRLKCAS